MRTATIDSPIGVHPTSPRAQIDAPVRRIAVLNGLKTVGRGAWKSLAIVAFLLLWEFGPRYLLDVATRTFLPPLHEDLQAGWRLFRNGQLADHVQASVHRSAI